MPKESKKKKDYAGYAVPGAAGAAGGAAVYGVPTGLRVANTAINEQRNKTARRAWGRPRRGPQPWSGPQAGLARSAGALGGTAGSFRTKKGLALAGAGALGGAGGHHIKQRKKKKKKKIQKNDAVSAFGIDHGEKRM